ncbi:MAG: LacI family DNA-binding transcriptional regulator [Roseibium sp.]|uniref:LacI family DNA-binding transcriptional regulator n=1 Tax=Roseibium sp. TaxID=1936156 RepID=UPI003D9C52CB
MDEKSRITLAEVAMAAGVSKMTASRALRGAGDVSTRNVEKVHQAAREMGYVGNHLASSLSGQRSSLIGVVVPSMANVVFAEVLAGIAEGIEGSGMQPVFGVTDYNLEKEYEVIRNMLSWNPAGLIVTGLDQSDDARRLLEKANIPVVQIMDLDGAPVDACVGFSQRAAGAAMAEALLGLGRKRFGYAGCGLEMDFRAKKRFEGFSEALSRAGLAFAASRISEGFSTVKGGRELTLQLLEARPDLDCICYSNDDLAAGGAFHCISAGLSVPDKLILAGFNGLEFVESLPVKVATSRTPRREIGQAAAGIVLGSARDGSANTPARIEFHPKIDLGI